MIIDSHTHVFFGGAAGVVAKPDELVASMRRAGIAKSLVFASDMSDCPTERMLDAIAPYEGTLHGIGSVTPGRTAPLVKRVEGWLEEKKIHGLKFYPGYEYFYPSDASLRPYLKLLAKHGRPAIFHSGDTYCKHGSAKLKYAHPLHIDDLATEMPDLKIIIAHVGYPWVIDAAEVCYKNKNVYVDCSGFVYGAFTGEDRAHFARMIRDYRRVAGSLDRVLFGTDWPISDQKSYVAAARDVFGAKNDLVFSGNAKQLFGL